MSYLCTRKDPLTPFRGNKDPLTPFRGNKDPLTPFRGNNRNNQNSKSLNK